MNQNFLDKLNEWYGEHLQRYEVLQETECDVLLLVAYRDSNKKLFFEIVRLFEVGDAVHISIDETTDDGLDMDAVLRLIKTALRVA